MAAAKTLGCVEFAEDQDRSEDRTLDLKRVVNKEQLNRKISVSVEFQAKSIGGGSFRVIDFKYSPDRFGSIAAAR